MPERIVNEVTIEHEKIFRKRASEHKVQVGTTVNVQDMLKSLDSKIQEKRDQEIQQMLVNNRALDQWDRSTDMQGFE